MRLDYPDGALDVVRWGLRLRLHPRDNGCEKNLLFTPQMYERVERAELAAEIARARAEGSAFVFIDVGANVGLFSLFVAAYARCQARILAVEPEPQNLARLRFNIRINSDLPIRVIPVALADRAGELAIQVDRRDSGGTRVRKIAGGEASIVEARTLLQVLAQGIDRCRRRYQDRCGGRGGYGSGPLSSRRPGVSLASPPFDGGFRGAAERRPIFASRRQGLHCGLVHPSQPDAAPGSDIRRWLDRSAVAEHSGPAPSRCNQVFGRRSST